MGACDGGRLAKRLGTVAAPFTKAFRHTTRGSPFFGDPISSITKRPSRLLRESASVNSGALFQIPAESFRWKGMLGSRRTGKPQIHVAGDELAATTP